MKLIKQLVEGDAVKQHFLINNVTKGITAKGSNYLNIILQDSSGNMDAKKWILETGDEELIKVGEILYIEGNVLTFNNTLQLKINVITPAKEKLEPMEFIKKSPIPKSELEKQFFYYLNKIENKDIKLIVETLIKEQYIQFSIYPAARSNHHAYASGLLHHTVSMLKLAEPIIKLYPSLNADYLYGGIILHDLGKTIERENPITAEFSTEGALIGHISMVQAQVANIAEKLNIQGEIITILQHLILSHHGKYEFGSPVLPATLEALVIASIDDFDAKMDAVIRNLNEVEEGEFTPKIYAVENRVFYKTKKLEKENK